MSKKKYENPMEVLHCPKCDKDIFRKDSSVIKAIRTRWCKTCTNAFNKREKNYDTEYYSMGEIELLKINNVLSRRNLTR